MIIDPKDYINPIPLEKTISMNRRKVLAYGDTKGGKTYLGGTFPGMANGEAFILDLDGSLNGLPKSCSKAVTVQAFTRDQINNPNRDERAPIYDCIMRLLSDLNNKPKWNPQTLMIDGLTRLSQFLRDECMWSNRIGEKGGRSRDPVYQKPTWDEYTTLQARLETIFSAINGLDMHIYVTALARRDKDDLTGSIIGMPDCEGSFRKEAGSHFDSVLILGMDAGKHVAYTETTNRMPAGIRGWCGPSKIVEPTFDKIFQEKYFE